jgi:hypothetical protein
MEGLNTEEKIIPIEEETRQEKIEKAEKNVFAMFDEKLHGYLENIGNNPYFQGLEDRGF